MKHIKNKNKKNTHIKIKKINIFFISHLTVPTPTLGHFRKTRLDSMLVHGPQRWEKRGAVTKKGNERYMSRSSFLKYKE